VGDVDAERIELPRGALGERAERRLGRRAKAEKPLPPRTDAVAPVKMMVPRPRGTMTRPASRAVRKPAKQAISHTFVKTRVVVSTRGKRTFAPMLKTTTSIAPSSASTRAKSATISSSDRASTP
jgi:hypothetical protein